MMNHVYKNIKFRGTRDMARLLLISYNPNVKKKQLKRNKDYFLEFFKKKMLCHALYGEICELGIRQKKYTCI